MRNNYYDSGWKWPQGEEENKGQPIQPKTPQPYGAVYDGPQTSPTEAPGGLPAPAPEPVAAQVERIIITRQEQLGATPPIREKKPRRVKRERTGVPAFLVCLTLIAALTAGLVYLRGGLALHMPESGLWGLWDAWEEWGGPDADLPSLPGRDDPDGWDRFYFADEEDWTARLKDTSIRKAPTGDGTVLSIAASGAEALSPQSIYDKVNPTIVGVQVERGFGYNLGSGVIFSADGYIVTNAHVIAGGKRAEVVLSDGTVLVASLVGYDKGYDLAVLKVKAIGTALTVAEFGDSDALRVGDPAWAIGNPLGMELRGTMTDGMVSAINREVGADNGTMTLIQTTAALNSGNSGGALINAAGQVVGITNMKMMSEAETIEGLGFAIPSRSVKEVADQIIAQGFYDDGVPLLGVTVSTILPDGNIPGGAYVVSVESASDAYKKGVRAGDIIVSANGETITDIDGLLSAKAELGAGDTLTLEIWREKGNVTVDIVLMTRHQMDENG
ncbi:MAG: trypsin-like peptidase domain-containing protein [Oscillospiraceae bacterium]|nr:trypsin-like peptidase domain-containing protein [Oscillospiraceae bacterium]